MSQLFNLVSYKKPKSNLFDLSHENKLSFNMGDLVPVLLEELVPGDNIRVRTEHIMRLAPMLAPIYHRVNVFTYHFFVPHRLVWSNWEEFIAPKSEGTSPSFPVTGDWLLASNSGKGSLWDYFGLPLVIGSGVRVPHGLSLLPFKGYQLIWNEFFRDQNLQKEVDIFKSYNGSSVPDLSLIAPLFTLRKKAWEKDYFTSALPFAQKGYAVDIPVYGSAPVNYFASSSGEEYEVGVGATPMTSQTYELSMRTGPVSTGDTSGVLRADLSEASGVTINDLRRRIKLQEFFEKMARGGSRYIEVIKSFWGITSSDSRLQRPRFVGASKSPVVISEINQTSQDTNDSALGDYAGRGMSSGSDRYFKFYAEEHGYFITLVCVMPRTAYFQGIPRTFFKSSRLDYYWPTFAHLGEQEVYDAELYFDSTRPLSSQKGTFGYQSRYSEYKFHHSGVHGDFRDTLKFWHMAREFATKPSLNGTFVESDPTNRIFNVINSNYQKVWASFYVDEKIRRQMPVFGTPSI